MVSNDKSCEEVLTQVQAAKSALDRVGVHAIAYTVKCCRTVAGRHAPTQVVDQALQTLRRLSALGRDRRARPGRSGERRSGSHGRAPGAAR